MEGAKLYKQLTKESDNKNYLRCDLKYGMRINKEQKGEMPKRKDVKTHVWRPPRGVQKENNEKYISYLQKYKIYKKSDHKKNSSVIKV